MSVKGPYVVSFFRLIDLNSTKEEEDLCIDNEVHREGAHPLHGALSRRGLHPINTQFRLGGRLKLTANASGPCRGAHCYAELVVSSPFSGGRNHSPVHTAPIHEGMAWLSGPE